jgi:diacylglycerol kinase family enzyme
MRSQTSPDRRRGWALLSLAATLVGLTWIPIAWLSLHTPPILIAASTGILWIGATVAARRGLAPTPYRPPERVAERPAHAVLFANPRSGEGKVERFGLVERARELGAKVVLLEDEADLTQLARDAVASGADALGVAGGDGTQAMVAAVAIEHDLPFLVVPAGTRNHFAMDLGLDRRDPAAALQALRDGVEQRVDVGCAGDRLFVNNVALGVYGKALQDPDYREQKARTLIEELQASVNGEDIVPLRCTTQDGTVVDGPQAVMISNNAYQVKDLTGFGRRYRMDAGRLETLVIHVRSAAEAAALFAERRRALEDPGFGLWRWSATEVTIESSQGSIPAGVDGETMELPSPVICSIRPGALRVLLPRQRPGVPPPRRRVHWSDIPRLVRRAAGGDPDA